MAIQTDIVTVHGLNLSLYVRINNAETSNHGVPTTALIRGFVSESAFLAGDHYIHEETVSFTADVSLPLWTQIYDEVKLLYPIHIDV